MESLQKATVIDGIGASEERDSQGEILRLAGADISEMVSRGYYNDNHGSGFLNTLGRITEAKKIFKDADCENDRQRLFFHKAGNRPYLYVKGYLFDDEDHPNPNAKAISAIMHSFEKMGTPMDVKMSVEGKILERAPGGVIAQSKVRNMALTLVPANQGTAAAIAGYTDSVAKAVSDVGGNVSFAQSLMKSIATGGVQLQSRWEEPTLDERAEVLLNKIAATRSDLQKMLTPGYGGAQAPATRVAGAALGAKAVRVKVLKAMVKTLMSKGLRGPELTKALDVLFTKFHARYG